eukprot:2970860-Prymnesium_polylepis.1
MPYRQSGVHKKVEVEVPVLLRRDGRTQPPLDDTRGVSEAREQMEDSIASPAAEPCSLWSPLRVVFGCVTECEDPQPAGVQPPQIVHVVTDQTTVNAIEARVRGHKKDLINVAIHRGIKGSCRRLVDARLRRNAPEHASVPLAGRLERDAVRQQRASTASFQRACLRNVSVSWGAAGAGLGSTA